MMKGVNLRLSATNKGGPALKSFERGLKGVRKAQIGAVRSNKSFMKGMTANRRIIQNVGFQISDFGVQIAGGQSAILSLTQNVPQVVQMFGAWGGILAGLITLFGTFILVLTKSGKGFKDIIPFAGVLSNEFEALGRAMTAAKEAIFDGVNLMVNNLDILFISATLLGGYMGTKWVISWLRAGKAVGFFNKMLVITRKVLIRTGIGALIVLAGYLIERMLTLKKVTGSWGETFKVVGDLAKQVFTQLPILAGAAVLKIGKGYVWLHEQWLRAMGGIMDMMPNWVNTLVAFFVGAVRAIIAAFKGMGKAVALIFMKMWLGIQSTTAKGMKKFITMMNKLPRINISTDGFDQVIAKNDKIKQQLSSLPKLGEKVGAAFNSAMGVKFVGEGGMFGKNLKGTADDLKTMGDTLGTMGDKMFASAAKAIPAWKELKGLLAAGDAGATKFDIKDLFGKDDQAPKSVTKTKDAVKKIKDIVSKPISLGKWIKLDGLKQNLKTTAQSIKDMGKSISSTLSSSMKGLIRGTKSFKDVMLNVLNTILDKMLDMMLNPIFDAIGGKIAGGLGGILSKIIPSFDGGGSTRPGVRTGGLDGKGGKLAMLHPNETVVDHAKGQSVSSGTTVTLNVYGVTDAESFKKSRRQITSDLRMALG